MTTPSPELLQAVRRFAAWLRWFMDTYPADVPSQAALARKLHVTPASISYLSEEDSTQAPSFKTLFHARALLKMPLDVMLFSDPPASPRGRRSGR